MISEYEKHFIRVLIQLPEILMIEGLILPFFNFLIASLHLLLNSIIVSHLILIVSLVMISLLVVVPASVSQREHIVAQL
jgi:hypothetical protein